MHLVTIGVIWWIVCREQDHPTGEEDWFTPQQCCRDVEETPRAIKRPMPLGDSSTSAY
jgi:hypothetical protein